MGSASELEYLLLLARDLVMLRVEAHDRLSLDTREVKRMLAALITRVASDRLAARSEDAP
jgi:four helix bundle protein